MIGARSEIQGVVFSKDRPLQLDGMLQSLRARCRDDANLPIAVLWTASDDRMRALYYQLANAYTGVLFLEERDFRRDVWGIVGSARFVFFAVDDAIFVRDFLIADGMKRLDADETSIGFSLRLGRNTIHCYPMNQPQALPEFNEPAPGFLSWDWAGAEHDFGYPLEVSSSIYRTADLASLLARRSFSNPNTLEGMLARSADSFRARRPRLVSYATSVAFCAPMNVVQTVAPNRAGRDPGQTPQTLAGLFEDGQRLDPDAYNGLIPGGCHEEVTLHLSKPPISPVVSVIVPCFDQAAFLAESVESVVGQTFEDWELIIVDDGSPDATSAIATDLIRKYPERRISLLRQANAGVVAARNAGIDHSRGRFILPLDADDRLDSNMLAACVTELATHPEVGIVYTDQVRFGESDRVVELPEFDPGLVPGANQWSYCALFRRGVWDAVGGYNPNMAGGYEDWEFWIGAIEKGFSARRIPRPLFQYRVKSHSRDTAAQLRDHELKAQIAMNHPALFTPGRRFARRMRRLRGSFRRRARRIRYRAIGGAP